MTYQLHCDDCINLTTSGKLLITDTPPEAMLSTLDVVERLEGFNVETYVICKDEKVRLTSGRIINRKHQAFGGNLFEKMKFAAYYIQEYSEPGDLVIDPFCGYSATGLAAVGLQRNYLGIDNKPEAIKESERILNGSS